MRSFVLAIIAVAALAAVPGPAESLVPVVGAIRTLPFESFEPTLGIDAAGSIFMSANGNRLTSPSDVDLTLVTLAARSDDQGKTWVDITPRAAGLALPPQSLDPYVYVDPDTGRVFLPTSYAECMWLAFSDDKGATWTNNPVGCGHPIGPIHDHQSLFSGKPRVLTTVGYPNILYYCVNRVVDAACASSVDGGLAWGPMITAHLNCGLAAHVAVAPDGTVYLPYGCSGVPTVAISRDDGLTWKTVQITKPVVGIQAQGHEVPIAIDEAGNVYAFWISTNRLPYLAVSKDGGDTWGAPIMVAPAGVGTTDFPTIAAGADGRIAFAYYGTAASKSYASMKRFDTWNLYIGVVTDATSASPTIQTASTNDPASNPLARGNCSAGSRCGPDLQKWIYSRGVGDFIDIVIDAQGRPWAAGVDVCNAACNTDTAATVNAAFGVVGTLAEGPALRGPAGPLPALG